MTALPGGTHFNCEGCGKSYRWKPELAGRKVKCGCGHVMTAPVSVRGDDLYDMVGQDTVPPPARVQPLEYRQPATPGDSVVERYFPDRIKDLYLPLVLIAGGTIIQLGYVLFVPASRSAGSTTLAKLGYIGMEMLIGTTVMLPAILLAGRIRKIDFGPLPVAIMKLCAVAIAPKAVAILLAPLFLFIPFVGGFGNAIVLFAMFFALLGALFDLDQGDTWYCVCVMFFTGLAFTLAMRFFPI